MPPRCVDVLVVASARRSFDGIPTGGASYTHKSIVPCRSANLQISACRVLPGETSRHLSNNCLRAARIAFWIAVTLGATLLVHGLGIVVVRLAGWRPPAWLEFPRSELAVLLLCLQPAAQCTGRESQLLLYHSGPVYVAAAC